MLALKNEINHVIFVIDKSGSMYRHTETVPQVVDDTVKHLAERSTELEQETRVTIYTFSSGFKSVECLVYDMDVLRLPSIKGRYKADNQTALIDASLKAIDDLSQTATLYGDHAFLMYVITDGLENASSRRPSDLIAKFRDVDSLGNWTYACFVPDKSGVDAAVRNGFPRENVVVWDAASAKGFETVGSIVRDTSSTFMTNRSMGVRSTKGLFQLNTVSTSDITRSLTPLTPGSYTLMGVLADQRVDEFVYDRTGRKLIVGKAYYQLTKKETIQPQKNIAIGFGGKVYTGPSARKLLGLPNETVEVDPKTDSYKSYAIFVQSTALNRKLVSGTNLLLMS